MLENVRFEPGETKNDPELARAYPLLELEIQEQEPNEVDALLDWLRRTCTLIFGNFAR